GGNVQLRDVDGTFNSTVFTGGVFPTPAGTGNQLALIASGGAISGTMAGDLVVDTALTLPATNNVNLLLGSTNGNAVTVNSAVTNNGATGTVTLVASSPVTINAAINSVGSINLTSAGNAMGDGVFIHAAVTASGSGATITVDANRDVSISGAS